MKTTTSIKLDKDTKEQAAALAKDLGLSLSSVINSTLKQFVRNESIFLAVEPALNAKTKKEFLEIRDDIKHNRNLSKTYKNVKELREALES
jgi:addiction module RelB/DinJ family antitoxin